MIGCRDLPDTGTARRAAAAILASAFWDDPLARYVEPDAALRPAVVAAFFDALIAAAVGPAAIHVTTGRIKGVAVWLPPSAATTSETELFVSLAAMHPYHAQRFEYAIGALDGIHESVIDVPHWYLIFLGVAPAAQGKGIGGRLLEATHAIADVGQTACFLETFDGPNVPFYQRRGYEIVRVRSVPFAVESVVAMRRGPRPRPQDHLHELRRRGKREGKSMGQVASEVRAQALAERGTSEVPAFAWLSRDLGRPLVDLEDQEAVRALLDERA